MSIPHPIAWYRSPVPAPLLKDLQSRSDFLGFAQSLGYLGALILTTTVVLACARWAPGWAVAVALLLHGTVWSFQINAVHELGHGTVFRRRGFNRFFEGLFAFLGWIHPRFFSVSHARHHQATLHPPEDLEVVLPVRFDAREFWKSALVRPLGILHAVRHAWRMARGRMASDWERALFPEDDPSRRAPVRRWARALLIGHGAILLASVALAILVEPYFLWVPLVVTLAPFYGNGLFLLCNQTQHIGLESRVPDFRRCCRSFTVNPAIQFLYWHMNYHTEHHMYPAVPCYRLGRLHRAVLADLPECPAGLIATWRSIARASRKDRPLGPSTAEALALVRNPPPVN